MTNLINRRAVFGASAAMAATLALPRPVHADDTPAAAPTTPRPSVAAYARTPMVDHIALSPDGKRIAAITQKGDDKMLITFDIGVPESKKSVGIGQVKVRNLFWGDDRNVVLVTSATMFYGQKFERFAARSINVDTYKLRTFFAANAETYQVIFGDMQRIKVDGKYRVTASTWNHNGTTVLYSFDFENSHGKLLCEAEPQSYNFVVTPDGRPVAHCEYISDSKTWTLFYNTELASGGRNFKRIYRQTGQDVYTPDMLGLGRDGMSVVIRLYAAEDESKVGYYEVSPDGTLSEPLDPEGRGKQRHALFHPSTGRLAGFAHHDDWVTHTYFEPLMAKLYNAIPQVVGEGIRTRIESYADDPRKMIVYMEHAQDAGSYVFCDFSTGDVTWLASNYPDLPEEWITEKQAITYKAADGLEIHAYLTLPPFIRSENGKLARAPKSPEKLPLIVLPHGGPRNRDYINFDWQCQTLAAHGYAVLQPNFRGSTGFGDSFVRAGNGEWGRKMQTDLSDGVRHLASMGLIDPGRVAILGASYGGYAALAGATLDTGVYRCAVSIAGVSDLKAMLHQEGMDSGSTKALNVVYWKELLGDSAGYDEVSPARQAAKAYCPILLMHGTDDTVVPIDQSKRMDRALKAAGKEVKFITYKGQDHWETHGSSRIAMMEAAISFLQKHNPA